MFLCDCQLALFLLMMCSFYLYQVYLDDVSHSNHGNEKRRRKKRCCMTSDDELINKPLVMRSLPEFLQHNYLINDENEDEDRRESL